ncbi:MAG: cation-translocating P-type ATPase [Methanomassiliicoccales archaeon]
MSKTRREKKEKVDASHLQTRKPSGCQFYVGGMACAFCAATIERGLKHISGVQSARVLMEVGMVLIQYDSALVSEYELKREIQKLGYYVFEESGNIGSTVLADSRRRALETWMFAAAAFLISIPLMFPVLMSSAAILPSYYPALASLANFAIATFVLFSLALPIYRGAASAIGKGILNEHVLYGTAGLGAYLLGVVGFDLPAFRLFFLIAVLLTALHLTAGWLGAKLRFNVEKSVRRLIDLRPPLAHVLRKDHVEEIPVSELRAGDVMMIKPGERVPADGIVIDGISEVAEAIVTGESLPLTKSAGDHVIGGSTNGSGSLKVKVETDPAGNYVSRILGLVRSAREMRPAVLSFFDRVIDRIWVPLVLGITVTTLIAWTLAGFASGSWKLLETGAISALLVAVIGYPCAIGFSGPSIGLTLFSEYADHGILVKDATLFERLKDVRTVVFDKTGTLTYGTLRITKITPSEGVEIRTVLRYAVSVEQQSAHPVALAVVGEAERRGIKPGKCENFHQLAGRGAIGTVEGKEVVVGSSEYLVSEGYNRSEIDDLTPNNAKSTVIVGVEGHVVGVLEVEDALRPDAASVVRRLKERGLHVMMLSGDTEESAEEISRKVGGIELFARQTPEDKIRKIVEIKSGRRGKVLMVGDGLNDAAALAAADVAVATAASLDISKDVADAVLVSSRGLGGILALMDNAKSNVNAYAGNVLLAISFNAVGIPFAALGILSAQLAMAIMLFSLLAVFTNAYLTRTRLKGRLARVIQVDRADLKILPVRLQ